MVESKEKDTVMAETKKGKRLLLCISQKEGDERTKAKGKKSYTDLEKERIENVESRTRIVSAKKPVGALAT